MNRRLLCSLLALILVMGCFGAAMALMTSADSRYLRPA